MEPRSFDAIAGPDRFATSDEIRAAICFLPDYFIEYVPETLWEVASDLGGHVLINMRDEDEVLTIVEKLDTALN